MKNYPPGDAGNPKPEQWAAYADGELDPAQQSEVEAWLAHHPEAVAEVEAQRRLARIWHATKPPEPPDSQWGPVLTRVQMGSRVRRPTKRRWLPWTLAPLAGAAAVLIALTWNRTENPVDTTRIEPSELLEVVATNDVEIVSLHASDRVRLVVGTPPVNGPLELIATGDVEVESIEPAGDGTIALAEMADGSAAPMIVAPRDKPVRE